MAQRTLLRSIDLGGRTDTLAGDLHETELGEGQHVVLGPVPAHLLLHVLVQGVAVFRRVHIDEIDDDDTTHIAEPELPRDLFGCDLVDLEGVLFLVAGLGADAIHHVEGFRALYHQVGALFHGHHLAEGALDLPRDLEMVEDGRLALVEMDDFLLFGKNQGNVVPDFLAGLGVVHMDSGERIVQQVPEDRSGLGVLGEEQVHALVLGDDLPRAFPFLDEGLGLPYQHRGVLAFGCGTDDGPVVAREYALYQGLESFLFLVGGNFLGDVHLVGERHKYNVASCQ